MTSGRKNQKQQTGRHKKNNDGKQGIEDDKGMGWVTENSLTL